MSRHSVAAQRRAVLVSVLGFVMILGALWLHVVEVESRLVLAAGGLGAVMLFGGIYLNRRAALQMARKGYR